MAATPKEKNASRVSYSPIPGPALPHHCQRDQSICPLVYLYDSQILAQPNLPPLPGQVGFTRDSLKMDPSAHVQGPIPYKTTIRGRRTSCPCTSTTVLTTTTMETLTTRATPKSATISLYAGKQTIIPALVLIYMDIINPKRQPAHAGGLARDRPPVYIEFRGILEFGGD
ncbi:hypothetical protein B0H17DRAFT_1139666 [Mycena rosella]|uniref:Uncharacterized protein n=1 Tax=Mycena rosella TaxID=1033263 RepID=A0AAD7D3H3_MYCRO|nr:hypothetical protein B0H17DRAFT_1139666 [Mycena rosella]